MPFYAVRRGRRPGIYQTWDECEEQVKKFSGAQFKKFSTEAEAQSFVDASDSSNCPSYAQKRERSFDSSNCQEDGEHSRGTDQSIVKRARSSNSGDWSNSPFEIVYTDGACPANGRRGARGGIGVYWGPNDARNVSEPLPPGRQTNNRAEILACARAIEQATAAGVKRLEVRTDSKFTIDCITSYLPKWKKKNFQRVTGEPILNLDEVLILDKCKVKFESDGGEVKFVHVNGHCGEVGNEAADRLAVMGSRKGI